MEHVYLLTNTFLDLIQRDDVLPKGINTTMIISAVGEGPQASLQFLKAHWQDLLLQYIGVLTTGVFGLLLAIILPLIGTFISCFINILYKTFLQVYSSAVVVVPASVEPIPIVTMIKGQMLARGSSPVFFCRSSS